MANIVFVHLLNDRSGSPRVLAQVIEALESTHDCTLYLGDSGDGILSESAVRKRRFPYRRGNQKLLTLVSYVWSQVRLFFMMLSDPRVRSADMIYINTLLPFGAALASQVLGRRTIYHLHEVSLSPPLLMGFLRTVARLCASRAYYVSEAHRALLPMNGVSTRVIPNAYASRFIPPATRFNYTPRPKGRFVCLMIASLRDYKGVPVLMSLARHFAAHSAFKFVLVANDSNERVAEFRLAQDRANVEIVDATDSPEVYYQSASILMNLSNPDEWIETFGLTLIEAMAFGVPVIAPPVGGPTEIVRHGVDGYLIDSREFEQLTDLLTKLSRDDARLLELSVAARERAESFSPARYQERVLSEIEGALADV